MNPPKPDECEISLFGPGVGECIVAHVGQGDWIVVDSCKERDGRPVALRYLDDLGVPPEAVKCIVLTHWHNDHVGGAGELVSRCVCARVYWSNALQAEEFYRMLVAIDAPYGPQETSEMAAVLQALSRSNTKIPAIEWATAGQRLWVRNEPHPVELWALSPSSASITASRLQLRKMMPSLGVPQLDFPRPIPNKAAVALWLKVGDAVALLGADLENGGNAAEGWRGVIKDRDLIAPLGRASVYKTAHHGSSGAHNPGIFEHLLDQNPICIVTPFSHSGLPKPLDLERLKNLSSHLYATALPAGQRPAPRSNVVDKALAATTKRRRVRNAAMGHVRLRHVNKPMPSWEAELAGPAYRV